MTSTHVLPDRLAELDQLTLDHGSHTSWDDGHCAMEVVAWLAGEGITDAPQCASSVLRDFTVALNDRWDDEHRQALRPYLPRMVGTAGDGQDDARTRIAQQALVEWTAAWLDLAKLPDLAAQARALTDATPHHLRAQMATIRSQAWDARDAAYMDLRSRGLVAVRERLAAVAADAAVAVDAAAAAAAAVAAAAAAAAAVAADADADAAVAAAAAAVRYAVYRAVRAHFRQRPLALGTKVHALAAAQGAQALDLLDKMIDPSAVTT